MLSIQKAIRSVVVGAMLARERWQSGVAYNPLSRRTAQDPYPVYAALRARDPVHRSALMNAWMFTRHADIDTILRDHRRFSNDPRKGTLSSRQRAGLPADEEFTMLFLDPPDHKRLRALVNKAFTPKAVNALEPHIRSLLGSLLDEIDDPAGFDLMQAVAQPLPVIVIAEDRKTIGVGGGADSWGPVVREEDYERWNDYGIGLLLQGDLKGAEYAFERVTQARPDFADGWLNVARSLIREGRTDEAAGYLERAREIDDSLGRIHFFRAAVARAEGDYDTAIEALERVLDAYPRDRVALNQYAVVLRLQRRYEEALEILDRVARIDPEDLQMYYTRMLCYRGLGDEEAAARAEARFLRFKADESAQTITASRRRQSAEDNNERQAIHEHVSVPGDWPEE